MFCPNCRNQVIEGTEICPYCGTNLNQTQQMVQQQPVYNNQAQNNYQQPMNNQNGNKKSILVPIIIVVVLTIAAVFGASKLMKKDTPVNNNDNNNQQVQENNNEIDNNTNENTTGTVDSNTNLTYDKNGAFLMTIEDVFNIPGRGTIATGRIERGTVKKGDEIQIIGLNKEIITTTVSSIDAFGKTPDYAEIGESVGLVLKDVKREDVFRGQVIAKPNSIKAITKFDANISMFSKEEGGRHTPFVAGYSPQFYFRVTGVDGTIKLPNGKELVFPGDTVDVTVELSSNMAMEVGTPFAIRENDKTIGKGTVTKLY